MGIYECYIFFHVNLFKYKKFEGVSTKFMFEVREIVIQIKHFPLYLFIITQMIFVWEPSSIFLVLKVISICFMHKR